MVQHPFYAYNALHPNGPGSLPRPPEVPSNNPAILQIIHGKTSVNTLRHETPSCANLTISHTPTPPGNLSTTHLVTCHDPNPTHPAQCSAMSTIWTKFKPRIARFHRPNTATPSTTPAANIPSQNSFTQREAQSNLST